MEFFRKTLFDKAIYEIGLMPQRSHFSVTEGVCLFNEGWYGLYAPDYDAKLLEYLKPDHSLEGLQPVQVNLPPQLQGYGYIQYANTQYPFDGLNPGRMGEEIELPNACMLYVKDFSLDRIEKNCQYILNFQGSESGLFLYVNGQFVGYSENIYLDSEFDLTPYLQKGNNRIGVLCFQYSTSTWLLDQDFFRFSGLFRDVTFQKRSIHGVYDIAVRNRVSPENRSSETTIQLTGDPEVLRRITLTEPQGTVVWEKSDKGLSFAVSLENLQLWSAEIPNLYQLSIESIVDGAFVETARLSIGFRHVEIRDGVLLLNGKRLIVNGVNRHEWNMRRGRSVTREDMEFDVDFLKKHNVNAVRTSHYPNHSDFYDLCDREGLYLVDEACLESHGSFATLEGYKFELGVPGDDPTWETICVQKLMRMYQRDKNHPSVIIWSLGNEAGYGNVFFQMRKALKDADPNAVIQYEQGYLLEDYMKVTDVYSSMYVPAKDVAAFIENGHTDKPYILCEYAHAMGNSLGDLDTYRELLVKYPTFQGGFVWDYIDQGLLVDGRLCYGGDNFDRPNDMDFCCNGVIFADREQAELSAKADVLKYYYQPIRFIPGSCCVRIENRHLFRNTADMTFRLEYLENGQMISSRLFSLELAPGKTGEYIMDTPAANGKEQMYRIFAQDKSGVDIACEEWVVSERKAKYKAPANAPKVVEGRFNIGVWAGQAHYYFTRTGVSYAAAGLTGIQIAGEEFIAREVMPTIFRPNTSNDIGNGFRFQGAKALALSQSVHCPRENVTWAMEGDSVRITYRYIMDHSRSQGATITYKVDGNGMLRVRMELDALEYLDSLPLVGMYFPVNKAWERVSWFGRGPLESYPDRKKGMPSGVYESTCREQYVPYIYPQECGNHEDVRYVQIHGQKASVRFEAGDKMLSFKYLPYSDFAIENATHVEDLAESSCNHLTICGFTRGVGGDDSWGSPVHAPFTLPTDKPYTFDVYLTPSAL